MRIVQVQHVYQLTFMPRLFPVNCYLVEEKEGLTLHAEASTISA